MTGLNKQPRLMFKGKFILTFHVLKDLMHKHQNSFGGE